MAISEAPDNLVSELPEASSLPARAGPDACPHLGLILDRQTRTAFPSPGNACHFVARPQVVNRYYQQNFCLTRDYGACRLLLAAQAGSGQGPAPKRLPADIAAPAETSRLHRSLLPGAIVIVILAGLLFAALLLAGRGPIALLGAATGNGAPPRAVATATPQAATYGAAAALAARPIMATAPPQPSAVPDPEEKTERVNSPKPGAPASMLSELGTVLELLPYEPSAGDTATPPPTNTVPPSATATPLPTATEALPELSIGVRLLNVFAGPSPDYPVIAWAARDERFRIVGRNRNGSWFRICCLPDGRSGWVYFENVIIHGDVTGVPDLTGTPWP